MSSISHQSPNQKECLLIACHRIIRRLLLKKGQRSTMGLIPKLHKSNLRRKGSWPRLIYLFRIWCRNRLWLWFPSSFWYLYAETDFDSDDCLLGGPPTVANSSPSQDIVVSSMRTCGKLEILIIQFQQKQQLKMKRRTCCLQLQRIQILSLIAQWKDPQHLSFCVLKENSFDSTKTKKLVRRVGFWRGHCFTSTSSKQWRWSRTVGL